MLDKIIEQLKDVLTKPVVLDYVPPKKTDPKKKPIDAKFRD